MFGFLRGKLNFLGQGTVIDNDVKVRVTKTSHQAKLEEKINNELIEKAKAQKLIEDKAYLAAETCPECGCACRHNRRGYGVENRERLIGMISGKCVICNAEWEVTYRVGSDSC